MAYIMNDFDNNFETTLAMDRTVERYNRHLKKTEYRVLNILKQHSLKIIGYSHLKLQTIADFLEISKKTVYRTLKNLHEKGYITKIHTVSGKRKNNGAMVFRINTYTQYEYYKKQLYNRNPIILNENISKFTKVMLQNSNLQNFFRLCDPSNLIESFKMSDKLVFADADKEFIYRLDAQECIRFLNTDMNINKYIRS